MKQSGLNLFTLILLYLFFGVGTAFLAFFPWLAMRLVSGGRVADARFIVYVAGWMGGVLCALVILFTLIRMIKSLRGDPFVMKNVVYLRRMGVVALIMVAFTLTAYFMYFTPLLLVIAGMELLCALFALVLRGVFQKAVEYREENALTI